MDAISQEDSQRISRELERATKLVNYAIALAQESISLMFNVPLKVPSFSQFISTKKVKVSTEVRDVFQFNCSHHQTD